MSTVLKTGENENVQISICYLLDTPDLFYHTTSMNTDKTKCPEQAVSLLFKTRTIKKPLCACRGGSAQTYSFPWTVSTVLPPIGYRHHSFSSCLLDVWFIYLEEVTLTLTSDMCFSFCLWMCNSVKQMGGGYVYQPICASYQHLFYHHWVYARLHYLNGICVAS